MDSNHRRQCQQIYSLSPLATWVLLRMGVTRFGGAGGRIRTPDLLITNQLLYQLSYTSLQRLTHTAKIILTEEGGNVNTFFHTDGGIFLQGSGRNALKKEGRTRREQ